MAVTEGQQTPDPFELDEYDGLSYPTVGELGQEDVLPDLDVYEGGTLGLHLGVLRAFAAMAPGAPPRYWSTTPTTSSSSIRPAVDR